MAGAKVCEAVFQQTARNIVHFEIGEAYLDFLDYLGAFLLHLKQDTLLITIKDAENAAYKGKSQGDAAQYYLEDEGIVPFHGAVFRRGRYHILV